MSLGYVSHALPGTGGESVRLDLVDGAFRAELRGLDDVRTAYARAHAVLVLLLRRGVPWPCPPADPAELGLGAALARGERPAGLAPDAARAALVAWQGAAFDRVLAARVHAIDVARPGDPCVDAAGAVHAFRAGRFERRAVAAGALHPSGPLLGPGVRLADTAPESTLLAELGVTSAGIARLAELGVRGGRRPLRAMLQGYELALAPPDGLELAFVLADEHAARALVREVRKVGRGADS